MIASISRISTAYPPGQGLSDTQMHLQHALINLQEEKNYKTVKFTHEDIQLRTGTDESKQQQV
jgi:hypothetical protein